MNKLDALLVAGETTPKVSEEYSDSEINALIAYVGGGCTDCDEEYGIVCTPCVRLAECVGEILDEHGHVYPDPTYYAGELCPGAHGDAVRLYRRYCADEGINPVGVTA